MKTKATSAIILAISILALAVSLSSCDTLTKLVPVAVEYLETEGHLSPADAAYVGIASTVLADGKVTNEEFSAVAKAEIEKRLADSNLTADQKKQLQDLASQLADGKLSWESIVPLAESAAETYAASKGIDAKKVKAAKALLKVLQESLGSKTEIPILS